MIFYLLLHRVEYLFTFAMLFTLNVHYKFYKDDVKTDHKTKYFRIRYSRCIHNLSRAKWASSIVIYFETENPWKTAWFGQTLSPFSIYIIIVLKSFHTLSYQSLFLSLSLSPNAYVSVSKTNSWKQHTYLVLIQLKILIYLIHYK